MWTLCGQQSKQAEKSSSTGHYLFLTGHFTPLSLEGDRAFQTGCYLLVHFSMHGLERCYFTFHPAVKYSNLRLTQLLLSEDRTPAILKIWPQYHSRNCCAQITFGKHNPSYRYWAQVALLSHGARQLFVYKCSEKTSQNKQKECPKHHMDAADTLACSVKKCLLHYYQPKATCFHTVNTVPCIPTVVIPPAWKEPLLSNLSMCIHNNACWILWDYLLWKSNL